MGNIFFIADTHFRGRYMLGYYERSFGVKLDSTDHYDNIMIKKWNRTIQMNDRVYVIGDFADLPHRRGKDYSLLYKLNGIKSLIIGTHDLGFYSRDFWYHGAIDKDLVRKYWIEVGFDRVSFDRQEIEYNGVKIVMTHERTIVKEGEINVYGHNHDVPGDNRQYHNVSVPVTNFQPISIHKVFMRATNPDYVEEDDNPDQERIKRDRRLFRSRYGKDAIYDPHWRAKDFVPRQSEAVKIEPSKTMLPSDYYVFPVLDYAKEEARRKENNPNSSS